MQHIRLKVLLSIFFVHGRPDIDKKYLFIIGLSFYKTVYRFVIIEFFSLEGLGFTETRTNFTFGNRCLKLSINSCM